MTQFYQSLQTPFLGHFWPFCAFLSRFFIKKTCLCQTIPHESLTLCLVSEKKLMDQFHENFLTDGRTDRSKFIRPFLSSRGSLLSIAEAFLQTCPTKHWKWISDENDNKIIESLKRSLPVFVSGIWNHDPLKNTEQWRAGIGTFHFTESTTHFLLHCRHFSNIRSTPLNSINEVLGSTWPTQCKTIFLTF